VITGNISRSFPELSQREVGIITNKFYRHLADVIVESVKLLHVSDEEMGRRVEVKNTDGLTIDIHRVSRALAPRKVPIPFEEHRQDSDQLFVGEEQVTTKGVEGESEELTWSENVDGGEAYAAPLNSKVTREPTAQIRSVGTKEVTPKALIEAGLDPKATLEEKTEKNLNRLSKQERLARYRS